MNKHDLEQLKSTLELLRDSQYQLLGATCGTEKFRENSFLVDTCTNDYHLSLTIIDNELNKLKG